jgi:predicted nucleic acid-binding protein
MPRLESFLARHARVGIDTSPFIYHIESKEPYVRLTDVLFEWLAGHSAVTPTLTLTEILVHAYRLGDVDAANRITATLTRLRQLTFISTDLRIADLAARFRAAYRLRTADAVQAATALASEATAIITNDRTLSRVTELEVFVLDDGLRGRS